jgi:hypothetical protein
MEPETLFTSRLLRLNSGLSGFPSRRGYRSYGLKLATNPYLKRRPIIVSEKMGKSGTEILSPCNLVVSGGLLVTLCAVS